MSLNLIKTEQGNGVENPADLPPIRHVKLALKVCGERGSTLVEFPHGG
jgi:hypothetical protein